MATAQTGNRASAKLIAKFSLALCLGATMLSLSAAAPRQAPPPAQPQQPPAEPATAPTGEITVELPPPSSLTEALLAEIEMLQMELTTARTEVAQARLEGEASQRELNELRQFVLDHERFGDDFQQYKSIKDITDRQVRARENEQAKAQKAAEKAERDSKRTAARSQAAARNAEANRIGKYKQMGFTPLGLDVFTSKMAFFYNTKESGGTGPLVNYDTIIGRYLQPGLPPTTEIDYSKMTISGSVLNATEVIRNIGVAITFFDDSGNQVGQETVEIKNARPDVPYPFTSKIDMALNRAFASSSTYVLYADPVE